MEKLLIGYIGKPFALKGEVKIIPETSFIEERYTKGRKLLLENPKTKETFEDEITSVRFGENSTTITLKNHPTIDDVESIYRFNIYMDKNEAPMPEGTYRIASLLDCTVLDKEGKKLGVVKDVLTYAPKSILRVGREKKKDFFVPFVDDYLLNIDLEKKEITILVVPEMFEGFTSNSIIKRAIGKGLVEIELVNIRDFTKDKYNRTDTPPVGGGAGLVQKAQPIVDALSSVKTPTSYSIIMSPRGKTYCQADAKRFSKLDHLIIVCGHYEGIDERVNSYCDESISIGDYILTGGEIPAMGISDSVIRLLDGAISSSSLEDESFNSDLLEYPQYTEPYDFNGEKIPAILYCGNHQAINKWRRKQSLYLTRKHRPDLFSKIELTKQDKKLLEEIDSNITPKWEIDAIEKGRKFKKE